MTPYYADDWLTIHGGDNREVMRTLPDESVQCVVTSPPYWGLRDYGTPGQLGLEQTPDEYVAAMVDVFREVRRVMRRDATLWLNLGDSYANTGGQTNTWATDTERRKKRTGNVDYPTRSLGTLKPKDLVGIPWRVAFALQQPYYTGRIAAERDRVWMAAMIDAEGTICGFRHERDNANVRTGMLVFITNSDTRVLDEADRIWPGARYIDHNRLGDDMGHGIIANRDSWRWQIQKAEERSAFVRELYPYLISKRQQAAVAWNLLEFTKAALRMGRGGETAEVKAKRDVLVGILSDLNHYRPVVIPSWVKEPPGMTEPGWYLRSDVIWSKNNPMPESVTDRPTKAHEYLFLLSKSATYHYDADAVREEQAPESLAAYERAKASPRDAGTYKQNEAVAHIGAGATVSPNAAWSDAEKLERLLSRGRNRRSVWTIATQPYPGAHFATFPEALVEPCILAGCPEGGVVMDPFAGTGTVGVVAQRLSRRALLIDLNPDYLRQCLARNAAMPLGLSA